MSRENRLERIAKLMVKAGLQARGLDVGPCRPPMGTVAPEMLERFLRLLDLHLGAG